MSMFKALQDKHVDLLSRIVDPPTEEFIAEVSNFILEVIEASSAIASPRDREQLRANLRYWATLVYDHTGAYPSTSLNPPTSEALDQSSK